MFLLLLIINLISQAMFQCVQEGMSLNQAIQHKFKYWIFSQLLNKFQRSFQLLITVSITSVCKMESKQGRQCFTSIYIQSLMALTQKKESKINKRDHNKKWVYRLINIELVFSTVLIDCIYDFYYFKISLKTRINKSFFYLYAIKRLKFYSVSKKTIKLLLNLTYKELLFSIYYKKKNLLTIINILENSLDEVDNKGMHNIWINQEEERNLNIIVFITGIFSLKIGFNKYNGSHKFEVSLSGCIICTGVGGESNAFQQNKQFQEKQIG